MTSLRFRLLFILLGLFILAWFGVVLATYVVTRDRIEALFDDHLHHDAQVLATLVSHSFASGAGRDAVARQVPLDFRVYRKGSAFRVWRDGSLLVQSAGVPKFEMQGHYGYRDVFVNERDWRLFAIQFPAMRLMVQVAEPRERRGALAVEITRDALYPLVLAIPLLGLALWFGVGRGLTPLKRVAEQVARLSPSRLDKVDLRTVPTEIDTLVSELNRLLSMLHRAFEHERRFTADAAHEIRTPLAGIKTHAQVALRATNDDQRAHALTEILLGVDRTSRLVEQLMTLARFDDETLDLHFATFELRDLINDAIVEQSLAAQARNITLYCANGARGAVYGSASGVSILLRNLLDNAIRYTQTNGRVMVDIRNHNHGVDLIVADNGRGIAATERQRIFDRFHRGADTMSTGCGLGLSIARRVVEVHGGTITLDRGLDGRGLTVQVNFPMPTAA